MTAAVAIIMGSQSDWDTMRHSAETLAALGVACEKHIVSAHRTPERLFAFAKGAKAAGFKIIIAGAGGAAHLPGMTASLTELPVFGVPIESKALSGLDSLYSIVQMPAGVPVGTLAIGKPGAINAALSIMVGGSAEDFAAAKPVLDAVGKTIVHVGPSGSGQTVKAANQLIVAGNIELLAEAIVFLQAYGVDTDAAVKVLGGGLAGSAVLNQKAKKMLDRDFDPGFRIDLHHKDLGIVTAAAREAGVVAPLGALVAQLMASARANGDGALDHSGLLRGVERLSGRTQN